MSSTQRPALFLLGFMLFSAIAAAQQLSVPAHPDTIVLDVVVDGRTGPAVGGLGQQDFTVMDNKSPRPLTSFRAIKGEEEPIEMILLVDAVNTTYQNIAYERQEIDKFLRANGGHLAHPTTLAVLMDTGAQIQPSFSRDGSELSASLDRYSVALRTIRQSAGFYGAAERFELSVKALRQLAGFEAKRPGRKIILWVSPGWPLLSGPGVELSQKQQQEIFATIVDVSAELRRARITLYSIDPLGSADAGSFRAFYYQQFVKGVSKPSEVDAGDLGLEVLATQSGGRALKSSNDIAGMLNKCVADTEVYYELSFQASPAEHRDEYHHVEVLVSKPGLTARTLQGYYAQP